MQVKDLRAGDVFFWELSTGFSAKRKTKRIQELPSGQYEVTTEVTSTGRICLTVCAPETKVALWSNG